MADNSCALWLSGCEVSQWRKLTAEAGVEHVGINYRYLRERCRVDKFSIEKHFPPTQQVWLDPGAFGINQEKWDQDALEDYLLEYISFAETNIGALTYVTELDATALGRDWILARRNDSYGSISEDKLVTVWHPEWGTGSLREMVDRHPNVGVPTLDKLTASRVHGLVRNKGIRIFGLRMDHPFELPGGIYKGILSASWISPMKYGETVVWDHNRMRRYPSSQKEVARKRHANDFRAAGFDPKKIAADDKEEVPRYTIWAWQQLEASLAKRRLVRSATTNGKGATPLNKTGSPPFEDLGISRVDLLLAEGASILSAAHQNGKSLLPALIEPPTIPGFGWREVEAQVPDPTSGQMVDVVQRVPTLSSQSSRVCGSCSLASSCPVAEPDVPSTPCKFSMPVEIRSRDQLLGTLTTLLEMQFQRIAFARFAEDLEGGYPNPNLSMELDRYYKLVEKIKDISDNRDTLNLQIKASNMGGGTGLLSRIFGKETTSVLREVDPNTAEAIVRDSLSGDR